MTGQQRRESQRIPGKMCSDSACRETCLGQEEERCRRRLIKCRPFSSPNLCGSARKTSGFSDGSGDTAAVSCLQGISRVRPASRQVPELEASSKSRSRAEAPRGRSLPTESRAVFS